MTDDLTPAEDHTKLGHHVEHLHGQVYYCHKCTCDTWNSPTRSGPFHIKGKPEWTNHEHRLAFWGSDGYDFFFCAECLVLSRDEKAYWAQSEEVRDQNDKEVKPKLAALEEKRNSQKP
jgi:hypothetical protein